MARFSASDEGGRKMSTPGDSATSRAGDAPEVGSVFVSNYPPYSFWQREQVAGALAALDAPPLAGAPLGLYVHIPFCRVRCKFCYFKVYTDKDSAEVRQYLRGVETEARLAAGRRAIAGRPLRFVYIGGGTPSFISSSDLRSLATALQAALPWTGAEEVTFECEPGTLTRSKLETIRGIGVTRLSLGVESFDDGVLQTNGRAHLSAEIDRALPWIREQGFDQLNIDLIAGMVGETSATWRGSVARAIEAEPDSVTIYQLELPYNTLFTKDLLGGHQAVPVASWEQRREWHGYAFAQLAAAGYEPSSAYTMVRRGRNARFVYRDSVWHGSDMLALGVASFSHVSGVHYQNLPEWGAYLESLGRGELPIDRAFATTASQRLTREWILQLKLGRVEMGYFEEKFGADVVARFAEPLGRLQARGMLRIGDGVIELTPAGLLQADGLLPEFYAPEHQGARYT
jgi:oxygen-independent coproporphyrinogen-3 oxidase